MNDRPATKLIYWPFLLVDVVFFGLAWLIYKYGHRPWLLWEVYALILCVGLGAFSFLIPFRMKLRILEQENLTDTVEQIKKLNHIADKVASSTGLWDSVQEQSAKTAETAKQVAQKMADEARSFSEFLAKANDSEKGFLKLEVDKLKRAEGEWLQTLVRILDHVNALHQGALQSRQPRLIEQLDRFQHACYDSARRVGLVPFIATAGETFDPAKHQPAEGQTPVEGKPIGQTIAVGFSFQGQLVRRALVSFEAPAEQVRVPKSEAKTEAKEELAAQQAQPDLQL